MQGETSAWWDRAAGSYDRSMWLLGGPLAAAIARTRLAVQGRGDVLEVAAGTGLVTVGLADVVGRLVATDYAPAMVDRLRERVTGLPNVEVRTLDLYDHAAFPAEAFDAIVAANVLHLVDNLPAALAGLRRWLRPGGVLVAPTYLHDAHLISRGFSSLMTLGGFPGRRRFHLDSLAAALESADLVVEEREQIPGLLPIGVVRAVREARVSRRNDGDLPEF